MSQPRTDDSNLPVVVVILNWNGRDDTVRCVSSVLADGIPAAQITVVDNGSQDDTVHAMKTRFPGVRILRNPSNLGFTGGMNRGIQDALARDAEHVCILNNDTVVRPGMFEALTEHTDADSASSPEVRYLDRPERVWFGGGTVDHSRCWPRHLTREELAAIDEADPHSQTRGCQTLAGCCIFAHASAWRRVGLLDERYFLIYEDADWSARAVEIGLHLTVVRDAQLLHAVSASFKGPGRLLTSFFYARNGLLFGRLHCRSRRGARTRFLRDQVIRPTFREIRAGHLAASMSSGVFSLLGVAAGTLHRYGKAPAWIESLARNWG